MGVRFPPGVVRTFFARILVVRDLFLGSSCLGLGASLATTVMLLR